MNANQLCFPWFSYHVGLLYQFRNFSPCIFLPLNYFYYKIKPSLFQQRQCWQRVYFIFIQVFLTSSTVSNHTMDEEVLQRWSQQPCVFSTDIQKKVVVTRWQISAYKSILRRTNKGESGLPQCHNFCFLRDVINESENCCDARGIAFPRHFFLLHSFVSYVNALEGRLAASKRASISRGDGNWQLTYLTHSIKLSCDVSDYKNHSGRKAQMKSSAQMSGNINSQLRRTQEGWIDLGFIFIVVLIDHYKYF